MRAGFFIASLRAFFVGAPGLVSVGQDRLILPDGDQAIAIYRGANIPISVGQDRLILPIRERVLPNYGRRGF